MAMEISIMLERLPQQSGLLGAVDDWTGVISAAERRKVQNRINQRAYRNRKRTAAKQWEWSALQSPQEAPQTESRGSTSSDSSETEIEPHFPHPEPSSPNELWSLFHAAANRNKLDRQKMSRVATICKLGPFEQQMAIFEFAKWIEKCQKLGSPRVDQLLILVKFNVFRAMVSNGIDLGYPLSEVLEDDDALSPLADPSKPDWLLQSVPAALQPTELQRQIPHHPWIDILPDPGMRDNILLAGYTCDDGELCADLVGFCSESKGRTGMIIWGEPWDIAGWEVTESFVEHWGWTIRGCEQLLRATNYWRESRGEKHLQLGKVLSEES